MQVVITDLDGTLLDHWTYSFEAAAPALEELRRNDIPLIFATSKTRAEVQYWRLRIGSEHPFIVENGGAVCVPPGYFGAPLPRAKRVEGFDLIEFGDPYPELVATLKAAVNASGCRVLGFNDMSVAELSVRTRLPVEQAMLAKRREYDESFEILGTGTYRLLEEIESRGKRWTRGDRFYHILGRQDKAMAVCFLADLYRKAFGELTTIGVGNGYNDSRLLSSVNVPVIVRSAYAVALRRVAPGAIVSEWPGPSGWNEAVLRALAAVGQERAAAAS